MTHHPATSHEAFARLRTALAAELESCVRMPAALDAVLLALLLRLAGALERLVHAWHAPRARALPAGLFRSRARIASGRVPPRAARAERVQDWWLRMNFGRGMKPSVPPPPPPRRPRPVRAPPPPVPV